MSNPSLILCPRCRLRQSRQIDLKFYLDENIAETEDATTIDGTPNPDPDQKVGTESQNQPQFCFACLGLLSNTAISAATEKVLETISLWSKEADGHDLKSIKVNLHTPPALFVTNYLCEMPLDAPPIHKIAKALINRRLLKSGTLPENLIDNRESDLDFSLKFEHLESEKRLLSKIFDQFPKIMQTAKYVKPKTRDGKSQDPNKAIDSHKRLKSEFYTEGTIKKCLVKLSKDEIFKFCQEKFSWSSIPFCYDTEIYRESIFFAGRYQKFSRTLPQTPWHIFNDEGELVERVADTSVQELLKKPFMDRFYPEKVNLCASGREDVDVRMLGEGRPFTLEFCNPRYRFKHLERLEQFVSEINRSYKSDEETIPNIGVRDLQICDSSGIDKLKLGWASRFKTQVSCRFSTSFWSLKVSRTRMLLCSRYKNIQHGNKKRGSTVTYKNLVCRPEKQRG